MASSYYNATGVLMLDCVTPVITALFGAFNLDSSYPGNGQAYIAHTSESNDAQWRDVLDGLLTLAAGLDLPTRDEQEVTIQWVLEALSKHFGAEQDVHLQNLIKHHSFGDSADLGTLLLIASCFNDGHNLAAIQFEGGWHCSKPRLFEFGGIGCFLSREIRLFSSSTDALQLGQDLRQAILADDLEKASARIVLVVRDLLSGISDGPLRVRLRRRLAQRLLIDSFSQGAG